MNHSTSNLSHVGHTIGTTQPSKFERDWPSHMGAYNTQRSGSGPLKPSSLPSVGLDNAPRSSSESQLETSVCSFATTGGNYWQKGFEGEGERRRGDIALVVSSAAAMQIGPLFANQSANSEQGSFLLYSRTLPILHKSSFWGNSPDKPSQVQNIESGPGLEIMGP